MKFIERFSSWFILPLLVLTTTYAQNENLALTLSWTAGTGQATSIEWTRDGSSIRVHTLRGVDILDSTLESQITLINDSNLSEETDLGEAGRDLTRLVQGDIWAWNDNTESLALIDTVGLVSALTKRPYHDQLAVAVNDPVTQQEYVELRDITTGQQLATFPHVAERAFTLEWRPDGGEIAIGLRDEIIIYAVESDQITVRQRLPLDMVNSIAWRSDNQTLAITTFDEPFFTLWDTTTQQPISSNAPEGFRGQLKWSNTGQYLAGRVADGAIAVWNYENGTSFSISYDVSEVADYAWGSQLLAVLLRDGKIEVWDAEAQIRLAYDFVYTGEVAGFSISPQTNRAAVVYQQSSTIHILNTVDGTQQYSLTPVSPVAPSDFSDVAWNANGQTLAVGYNDYVEVWAFDEATATPIVVEYDGRMPYLAWSPVQNNQLWISWGNDDNRSLLSVDVTTGSIEERISIDGLGKIAWRPDGEQLAVYRYVSPSDQEGNTSNLQILDAQTYEALYDLAFAEMTPTTEFSWLPDGRGLFGIECHRGRETCGFWTWDVGSVMTPHAMFEFPESSLEAVSFALDPQGRYIAVGDIAKPEVHIYSRDTLERLITLDGFDTASTSIEWASNGILYISDGTLWAFDVIE